MSDALMSAREFLRGIKPQWWMLGIAGLLGLVLVFLLRPFGGISSQDVFGIINNGVVAGFTADGTEYRFTSATTEQSFGSLSRYELTELQAEWRVGAGEHKNMQILATAPMGFLDVGEARLTIPDTLTIQSQEQNTPQSWTLTTADIVLDIDAQTAQSKTPAELNSPAGQARGNYLTLNHREQTLYFVGDVTSQFRPSAQRSETPTPAPPSDANPLSFNTDLNAPIHISAPLLAVDYGASHARYIDGVQAKQGDAVLFADELQITFGNEMAGLAGFVGTGNARLVSEDRTAYGQWFRYDATTETFLMGDTVRIVDTQTTLTGEELQLNLATGTGYLRNKTENTRTRARFLLSPKNEDTQ